MSYSLHLLKKMLIERGITNVLLVNSERNVNVGTEGHTDWDKLKGMEADSVVFDDLLCKPIHSTVKAKPLYTQLHGRWGK